MSSPPLPPCDVVGLGANSVDTVCLLPAHPTAHGPLSKIRISSMRSCPGGQTATALATCASLGLRARYIGAFGADERGRQIREALIARNVEVSGAIVKPAANQFAVILIDQNSGERIVLWDRDSRLGLLEEDDRFDVISSARLLHVDDVDEAAAIRAARFARTIGIPVTSDLDRLTPSTEQLLSVVTVPVLAQHLTAQLTGEDDYERALRKLRRLNDGLLVVTLGASGAMALDGDRFLISPGFEVDAVDTTGSGDVFRGGLIFGLLAGWSTPKVLRFANAAAAVSCTRVGALDGVPARDAIDAVMAPVTD